MDKIVDVIEIFDDSGFLGSFPEMRHGGRPASERDILGIVGRAEKFFKALFPGSELKIKMTEKPQ